MTLRITIEVIPIGDESRKELIKQIDVVNVGPAEGGLHHYMVRQNDAEDRKRFCSVTHNRSRGAMELVGLVIETINKQGGS